MKFEILGYRLEGGGACPEQYDVFDETGKQVAYMRLRHGEFTVHITPYEYDDPPVFEGDPNGDGSFDDNERIQYLTDGVLAVKKALNAAG